MSALLERIESAYPDPVALTDGELAKLEAYIKTHRPKLRLSAIQRANMGDRAERVRLHDERQRWEGLLQTLEYNVTRRKADPLQSVKQLRAGFDGLPRELPVSILQNPTTGDITLPDDPTFNELAREGGLLLALLPEHWRYGVSRATLDEADPAKRWARALFDYALHGLVDVPSFDIANHTGRIDETIRASVLACETLVRYADRPHWGKGTLASALEFARVNADDLLKESQGGSSPVVATLYSYTCGAFQAAVAIAKMSRAQRIDTPRAFVYQQVRLDEYLTRAMALLEGTGAINQWSTTPGTVFSWKAGDSALSVAIQFSQAIHTATVLRKSVGGIGGLHSDHRVSDSDPEITAWRDATVKELLERTLPAPPAWPMWEIHRDVGRLGSLLRDEYERTVAAARAEADREETGDDASPRGIPDGFYSPTEIAEAMNARHKADAIRKALKRLFSDDKIPGAGWMENANPAHKQAKILYKLSEVRPFLKRFEQV